MFDADLFAEIRKEFAAYLRFTKGYSKRTCYQYNSDLGIWSHWMQERSKDWQRAQPADVEQFIVWELQERGVGVHIVSRRISCLSTFYRWAKRNEIAVDVPTLLADKPKRHNGCRSGWAALKQKALEDILGQVDDLPDNIYGMPRNTSSRFAAAMTMLFCCY